MEGKGKSRNVTHFEIRIYKEVKEKMSHFNDGEKKLNFATRGIISETTGWWEGMKECSVEGITYKDML